MFDLLLFAGCMELKIFGQFSSMLLIPVAGVLNQ